MYVQGDFKTAAGFWVIGDIGNMCSQESPDNRWVCTRTKGHEGIHVAGISLYDYKAQWYEEDFWESMGL